MSQIGQYPNAFYRVTLKAIIRNADGEVLVVKEKNNPFWSLPGGGMDHGETDVEAIKRELFEEVAWRGEFTSNIIGIQSMYVDSKDACLLWIVYEVNPDNDDYSVGLEANAITWIDPKTLKNSSSRSERLVYKFCVDKDAEFE